MYYFLIFDDVRFISFSYLTEGFLLLKFSFSLDDAPTFSLTYQPTHFNHSQYTFCIRRGFKKFVSSSWRLMGAGGLIHWIWLRDIHSWRRDGFWQQIHLPAILTTNPLRTPTTFHSAFENFFLHLRNPTTFYSVSILLFVDSLEINIK